MSEKALDAKDGPGAIAHFRKAIELYPNYAEAYQLLGGAYLGGGNLPEGVRAFIDYMIETLAKSDLFERAR